MMKKLSFFFEVLLDLQALLVLQKLAAFLSWMIGWIDSYIDVADAQDLWPDEYPKWKRQHATVLENTRPTSEFFFFVHVNEAS